MAFSTAQRGKGSAAGRERAQAEPARAPAQAAHGLPAQGIGQGHAWEAERIPAALVSGSGWVQQRQGAACDDDDDDDAKLQREAVPGAGGASAAVPPIVGDVLRSSGKPLDPAVRAYFEPRFGRDFSEVRIHAGAQANASARAVNARAYTVGPNVAFRQGAFAPDTAEGKKLLAHELTHVVQHSSSSTPAPALARAAAEGMRVSDPNEPSEQEADRVASAVMRTDSTLPVHATRGIGPAGSAPVQRVADGSSPPSASAQPGAAPQPGGLIVDDAGTQPLDPKQMRKRAFLAALRPQVEQAVDDGYPDILDRLAAHATVAMRFAMYGAQDARSLEQSIHGQVPGTSGVATAAGYIPVITARVKKDIAADNPEKKSEVEDGAGASDSSFLPGIFFKGRDGGPREANDPRAIRAELGRGQPLAGGVRSGVESAMGHDFSRVRVHAGATAAKLSGDLNARAFTVGQDIAFGAGEYQPGTPVGDALIAHELAHVVQQGNSSATAVAPKSESGHDGPLEADADASAVGAVLSMWGGIKAGALGLARSAGASLKTGLKLQRCQSSGREEFDAKKKQQAEEDAKKYDERKERSGRMGAFVGDRMKSINDSMQDVNASHGRGVWYEIQLRGTSDWRAEYADGFTRAPNLLKTARYTWVLTGGTASGALDAWFAGLTIADCASTMTAAQYSALRSVVGVEKFNQLYSGGAPERGPLIISQATPPGLGHYLDSPTDGEALKVGDRVYIANHPKYALRHPNGPWQGEHAIVAEISPVSGPLYAGFGVGIKNEDDHLKDALDAYNTNPSDEEKVLIKARSQTAEGAVVYAGVPAHVSDVTQMKAAAAFTDPFRGVNHPKAGVQVGSQRTRFNKERVMEDIPKTGK